MIMDIISIRTDTSAKEAAESDFYTGIVIRNQACYRSNILRSISGKDLNLLMRSK